MVPLPFPIPLMSALTSVAVPGMAVAGDLLERFEVEGSIVMRESIMRLQFVGGELKHKMSLKEY